jgi:hypothetical protein
MVLPKHCIGISIGLISRPAADYDRSHHGVKIKGELGSLPRDGLRLAIEDAKTRFADELEAALAVPS